MVTAHLAEEQTGVYRLQLEVWLRRQAILVSIGVFDGYSVAYTKQLANNRIEDFCYALGPWLLEQYHTGVDMREIGGLK